MGLLRIHFCIEYNKLPLYKLYWGTSEDINVCAFLMVISKNRFWEVVSYIHVNNNAKY